MKLTSEQEQKLKEIYDTGGEKAADIYLHSIKPQEKSYGDMLYDKAPLIGGIGGGMAGGIAGAGIGGGIGSLLKQYHENIPWNTPEGASQNLMGASTSVLTSMAGQKGGEIIARGAGNAAYKMMTSDSMARMGSFLSGVPYSKMSEALKNPESLIPLMIERFSKKANETYSNVLQQNGVLSLRDYMTGEGIPILRQFFKPFNYIYGDQEVKNAFEMALDLYHQGPFSNWLDRSLKTGRIGQLEYDNIYKQVILMGKQAGEQLVHSSPVEETGKLVISKAGAKSATQRGADLLRQHSFSIFPGLEEASNLVNIAKRSEALQSIVPGFPWRTFSFTAGLINAGRQGFKTTESLYEGDKEKALNHFANAIESLTLPALTSPRSWLLGLKGGNIAGNILMQGTPPGTQTILRSLIDKTLPSTNTTNNE